VRPVGDDDRPVVQTREDLDYYRTLGENKRKTLRRVIINPSGVRYFQLGASFLTPILCIAIEMFRFIERIKRDYISSFFK